MEPKIIGISGKIGSGKSTLSKIIQKKLSKVEYQEWNFADNLKKIVAILLGYTYEEIITTDVKSDFIPEIDMNVRQVFQKVGTDCLRNNLHNDIWVISLMLNYIKQNKPNIIIADVRFPNEAKFVLDHDGILIRINRNLNSTNLVTNLEINNHISETALDDFPFENIIENNGTIDDLENSFMNIINKIKN